MFLYLGFYFLVIPINLLFVPTFSAILLYHVYIFFALFFCNFFNFNLWAKKFSDFIPRIFYLNINYKYKFPPIFTPDAPDDADLNEK